MIKAVVVDDEQYALEWFHLLAQEIEEIDVLGLFESVSEARGYMQKNAVDVVFLDIEMPEQDGLMLAMDLLDINPDTEIVFLTAYNQYAIEAFECNALDYILKPITEKRLQKTIARLKRVVKPIQTQDKPYIRCFGSFELFVDEQAVTWRNSKAKEALAFLVHKKGIPVSWEVIADALWPDYDIEKAHANFHSTMYLLRKHLKNLGTIHILECKRGNYRVKTDRIRCDYYSVIQGSEKKPKGQGYMEDNGYLWAYGKAFDIEQISENIDTAR